MSNYKYRIFFCPTLMREQIGREFDEKIKNLDEEDPFYMSTLKSLERKKEEDLVLKNIIKQKRENLKL